MKELALTAEEVQELKNNLLCFVRRTARGVDNSPGEAQILPEIVKLLLDFSRI